MVLAKFPMRNAAPKPIVAIVPTALGSAPIRTNPAKYGKIQVAFTMSTRDERPLTINKCISAVAYNGASVPAAKQIIR
jgi:hypothetical protein